MWLGPLTDRELSASRHCRAFVFWRGNPHISCRRMRLGFRAPKPMRVILYEPFPFHALHPRLHSRR
jgi:hypothetical protein